MADVVRIFASSKWPPTPENEFQVMLAPLFHVASVVSLLSDTFLHLLETHS